jgi:hypothetical protein
MRSAGRTVAAGNRSRRDRGEVPCLAESRGRRVVVTFVAQVIAVLAVWRAAGGVHAMPRHRYMGEGDGDGGVSEGKVVTHKRRK